MRPIFYDTETTGIRSDKDRIIEFAAFDPVKNKTLVKLINPGCPIPAEATAIHHISNDMVANAPSFDQIIPELLDFCEGNSVLIAHNNDAFDMLFLRNEFSRHNVEMPSWRFLDSLKWARRYRPDLPRHSLQFLREIYGVEANNAHRALDDVTVLHQVFIRMTDDLKLEQIFGLLNQQRMMSHMPFGKHQGKPLSTLPRDYVKWLSGSGALDKQENQELKTSLTKLGLLQV